MLHNGHFPSTSIVIYVSRPAKTSREIPGMGDAHVEVCRLCVLPGLTGLRHTPSDIGQGTMGIA